MNILFLRGFNNYFNRRVKKYTSLGDYRTNSSSYLDLDNINFNPNDGVVTELIVGNENQKENNTPLNWENIGTPDYCICYENVFVPPLTIPFGLIRSRWFVLESERTRTGQYRIALKRDVVAEYFEQIKSSPCFIEKGTITDVNNPLIFNKESMTYNQIKQVPEILLKDRTQSAWVVGYIPRNFAGGEVTSFIPYTGTADITTTNINTWAFIDYVNNPYKYHVLTQLECNWQGRRQYHWERGTSSGDAWQDESAKFIYNRYTNNTYSDFRQTPMPGGVSATYTGVYNVMPISDVVSLSNGSSKTIFDTRFDNLAQSSFNTTSIHFVEKSVEDTLIGLNNKIIYDSTSGKYYKINLQYGELGTGTEVSDGTWNTQTLRTDVYIFNNFWEGYSHNGNPPVFGSYTSQRIYIILTEMTNSIKTTIQPEASRYHLSDSPYDLFCMPYSPIKIYENGTEKCTANGNAALQIATEISSDLGEGAIYDVQLLPYCPIQQIIQDGYIDLGTLIKNYIYDENDNIVNVMVFASTSQFEFNIDMPLEIDKIDNEINALALKISNETDLYRLNAPNWSSMYEFSLAKMGGWITGFNVDCNYKPFSPYIHINPIFKGLYGQDFNDARGLICSGDYSLPAVSNSWANYVQNNKNYQNIFDRQIQNMDVNNSIAMEQARLQAFTGAAQNAISGSITGGMIGAAAGSSAGPWGTIAGAAIGGVAGIGAGVAAGFQDVKWLERQQQEARSFAVDMYGYQLGNIKAIPNALSKISSFTANNKIWPVLEKYTCTPEEKEALKQKLTYDGFTLMVIGKIENYPTGYIKGQMIKINDLSDDFHIADAIYQEVQKGLYLTEV